MYVETLTALQCYPIACPGVMARFSQTAPHRQKLGFNRVSRVTVGIRVRFSLSGAKLLKTRGGVANPGWG